HAYLSAPYGVYPTKDGYLAIAMTPLPRLEALLELPELGRFSDPRSWFSQRDEIKQIIASHLETRSTDEWLTLLEPADIWCSRILSWAELLDSEGFKALDLLQTVTRADDVSIVTTR